MGKYRYTNPDAHGYLMEAAACKKVCKEIDRLVAKFNRAVEREKAARKTEFETVMQYRSEREIQDDYGYECITEEQYDRYIQIFRAGQEALENTQPTVNELVVSILKRINGDIYRDQKEWEFSALTPEQQEAERKRARESQKAWKKHIAEIKARLHGTEKG
mgnify:CR=1 FL=1